MSFIRRIKETLHCRKCDTDKPASQFYLGSTYICMSCKREQVNAYKRRTDYNRRYREGRTA